MGTRIDVAALFIIVKNWKQYNFIIHKMWKLVWYLAKYTLRYAQVPKGALVYGEYTCVLLVPSSGLVPYLLGVKTHPMSSCARPFSLFCISPEVLSFTRDSRFGLLVLWSSHSEENQLLVSALPGTEKSVLIGQAQMFSIYVNLEKLRITLKGPHSVYFMYNCSQIN